MLPFRGSIAKIGPLETLASAQSRRCARTGGRTRLHQHVELVTDSLIADGSSQGEVRQGVTSRSWVKAIRWDRLRLQ
jgi:hypothetical protein